ncbi:THAP domain-containing protein 1-like [Sitophilus oryzae]|uniref:THAP domain-containing protein 1-like n=1 Tax=Sitophilus oryzae TaxID=7048 RepID=A0A6J2Y3D5_SITOR|nr:THAP domain-containing protein 1-like [Sitophilus oryzae]
MSAKKCSVPGCINGKPKRHRFPKSDPAIFRQWLVKIDSAKLFSMDNETIYRLCRVCDKHFTRDCIVEGTKRGLKRTAVPTLYLPASRSASCEIIPQPGTSSEGYEIDVPSSIPTLMDHDYIAYESPKTATKSVANTSPIVHKTGSAASRSASSDIIPQPGTSSEDYEIDVPSSVPTLMDHDYIAYESPKTATKSVANTSPIVYKTGSAGNKNKYIYTGCFKKHVLFLVQRFPT